MAQDIPKTTKQWAISSQDGSAGFDALKFSEEQIPALGDSEVLVKRTLATVLFWLMLQNNLLTDVSHSSRGFSQREPRHQLP